MVVAHPPAGWRIKGLGVGLPYARHLEVVYATPDGERTWCEYSEAIWEAQRSAVREGREPGHEVFDDRRRAAIEDLQAQQRSVGVELAKLRAQDEADATAAVTRENNARAAAAEMQREGAILALVGILIAKEIPAELASIRVCELKAEEAEARAGLDAEKRLTKVSGVIDMQAARAAGEDVVRAQDELRSLERAIKQRLKLAPVPCSGLVQADAVCSAASISASCGDGSRARLRAFEVIAGILRGAPLSAIAESESIARAQLDDDGVARAEAAAQRLAHSP
jgi:hypothetical protein